MRIGIIKEGKIPADTRVAIPPSICRKLKERFENLEIAVESSETRCFSDAEYLAEGIEVKDSVDDFDVLFGVKEVPIDQLIEDKTYLFFSHTIKKQPYNQKLMQAFLKKNIRLIDYECLKNSSGIRVIAFGRFAGIVGAHNGLYTWGKRIGNLQFPRINLFKDLVAAKEYYKDVSIPPVRILVTGNGRVAKGSVEVLDALSIKRVEWDQYLQENFDEPVYVQLDSDRLYRNKSVEEFNFQHFFQNSDQYYSIFSPYMKKTDLLINAIYWDPKTPAFFSAEDMADKKFSIKTIADITCDIAPESSIPSTLRASTIVDPVYGYDPDTRKEIEPFSDKSIDIMAVDNLPNELPRDASQAFGEQMLEFVFAELLKQESEMIRQATITKNGDLTSEFEYLRNYAEGKE